MNAIKLLEKLEEKTIITRADIERIAEAKPSYAKLILSRLKKRNLIQKVAENRYTLKTNPFVIATNLITPSYLSWWSASHHYGFTEQILKTIYVATTTRKKQVNFEGYNIQFIPIKNFFGYVKEKTNEGDLFIVEKEKLLIDAFLYPKYMGNISEIIAIIKNAEISPKKLSSYLKNINNQTLIKRIGFLYKKLKGITLEKQFVLDNNYVYLNPFSKREKY